VTRPGLLRRACCVSIGVAISRAATVLIRRRARTSVTPTAAARAWLTDLDIDGVPAVTDPIIEPCADGLLLRPAAGEDWFFISHDGVVHILPPWCDGPQWVSQRYATIVDRSDSVIGPPR